MVHEMTARDRDASLETFAAELTNAAYAIALRHRTGGSWVDLELALWRVLAETVIKWELAMPRAAGQPETGNGAVRDGLDPWRGARSPFSE